MALTSRTWKTETKVNFSGNGEIAREMKKGLQDTTYNPRNPYSVAFKKFGEVYRQYLRKEFNANKDGGGRWAPIKKSTIRWRKWKHGIKHKKILYVTRTLYRLTVKKYTPAYGQYEKRTKYGITVGSGGRAKHPDSRLSIHHLVKIHAKGLGRNLPERKIFVDPDQATINKMDALMQDAHRRVVKKANKKLPRPRNS